MIDESMKAPCAGPVAIPEGISDLQAGRLWDRDRDELTDCKLKHGALAGAVTIITRGPR